MLFIDINKYNYDFGTRSGWFYYKKLIKRIAIYIFIFSFLLYQLLYHNLYKNLQKFCFYFTDDIIFISRNVVLKVSEIFSYANYIFLINNVSNYYELEKRNKELESIIILKNKEIEYLKAFKNVLEIDNNFGHNYVICDVKFYFAGPRKMISCSIVGKQTYDIKENSIVINDAGLVGKVIDSMIEHGVQNVKIQLASDFRFRIPVITSSSFSRGVAYGGNEKYMIIFYAETENIANKESVFIDIKNIETSNHSVFIGHISILENGDFAIKLNNKLNNLSFVKILL